MVHGNCGWLVVYCHQGEPSGAVTGSALNPSGLDSTPAARGLPRRNKMSCAQSQTDVGVGRLGGVSAAEAVTWLLAPPFPRDCASSIRIKRVGQK